MSAHAGIPVGDQAGPSPAACRRRLGHELRRLREARSLRLEDVVAHLGVQPSTLSRIETGQAPTRTSYLTVLLDLYGVDDQAWRELLADQAREGQRKSWHAECDGLIGDGADRYLDLEADASRIRGYSVLAVPGLLQTQDYAAAACRAARPGLTTGQVGQFAVFQMRRQEQALLRAGRDMHLLIDQSVLLRMVGTPGVMACQLKHLLAVAVDGRARLQVIPLANKAPAISPSFMILEFAESGGRDVGCFYGPGGQVVFARRDRDLASVSSAFEALALAAASPALSIDLIKQAATRWDARTNER